LNYLLLMCFMPFLATKTAIPLVPQYQNTPGIALQPVRPEARAILDKFTLPHPAEIKLVIGCGCWLRHVEDRPQYATVESLISDPKYDPAPTQPNHDGLVDFLRQHFTADGFVEFYGCNDGDYAEPAREHLRLSVKDIRDRYFHFRVGSHYSFLFG
jgi:hypothetical protein